MLNVRAMTLLRELELRGSIAAVSRAVGISSSAISQQLTRLESEVGFSLLEQVGRNVQLTTVGVELAHRAEQIVSILESTEAELDRRRSHAQGVLRFATFSTFAVRHLPDVLARMTRTHPDVVVEYVQMEPSQALEAIAGRRIDVAVTDEYPGLPRRVDTGVVRTPLLRDQMVPFAGRSVTDVIELADVPWVFEPAASDSAIWSTRVCRDAGFEPVIRYESVNLNVHHALALNGHAAAFLPEMLFRSPTLQLREPTCRVDWPEAFAADLYRDVFAVTRRGSSGRPLVKAFLGHLQEVCRADGQAPTDRPPTRKKN